MMSPKPRKTRVCSSSAKERRPPVVAAPSGSSRKRHSRFNSDIHTTRAGDTTEVTDHADGSEVRRKEFDPLLQDGNPDVLFDRATLGS